MKIIPPLYESLQFLLLDVQKQLQLMQDAYENKDAALIDKSLNLIDYIENTHLNLLQRASQQYHFITHINNQKETILIQSYEHIAHSLTSLSKQLYTMAQQLQLAPQFQLLHKKFIFSILTDLNKGLSLVVPAMETPHLGLSIDICKLQSRIEKTCNQQLQKYKKKLRTGQHTDALLQACFVLKDLTIMGDALLRVGEGIISANLGQFIQIDRYHALKASLDALGKDKGHNPQFPELNIHSMGETKSGCIISGVQSSDETAGEIVAIFKQGKKSKLSEEKANIESWHQKFPGIAPKVFSYQKHGNKAALLYEYLTGQTFDKLLQQKDRNVLRTGLAKLFSTLTQIWQETQIETRNSANYMQQLAKRLPQIYDVHPEFNLKGLQIGKHKQLPMETLIQKAKLIENQLSVPKSVYIHGDFNTDNILYDPVEKQISFIDLHRSDYLDYVQDLSVLMVSFYRVRSYDPKVRAHIAQSMQAIYKFGSDYASTTQDADYPIRMALGLARSFITSTRFVLDPEHAKAMHHKGRYLIEQVIQLNPEDRADFQIPGEIYYDPT